MRALLDVNVLIALCDAHHEFHLTASDWLLDHAQAGWASCPLTQNGAVRILSQSAYINARPMASVLAQLRKMCESAAHAFWPDDISLLGLREFNHAHIHGHRQITDTYLLGLAVKQQGRLVTFDEKIPLSAVVGATPAHLLVL